MAEGRDTRKRGAPSLTLPLVMRTRLSLLGDPGDDLFGHLFANALIV
jgi:hypothetical protein